MGERKRYEAVQADPGQLSKITSNIAKTAATRHMHIQKEVPQHLREANTGMEEILWKWVGFDKEDLQHLTEVRLQREARSMESAIPLPVSPCRLDNVSCNSDLQVVRTMQAKIDEGWGRQDPAGAARQQNKDLMKLTRT